MPTPLTPIPPALRDRPFTRTTASRLGVGAGALRGTRFGQLTQGIWAVGPEPSLRVRVAGALAVLAPETAATGCTGLQLYGVDVGPSDLLTFVTAHPHQVRRAGLRVVRRTGFVPTGPIEPPARCFADADLPLVELVIAGDWLLRLGLVTRAGLAAAVVPGRRGSRTVVRAAGLVRPKVESPKETELRLVCVLAGLPDPKANFDVGDVSAWLGRGDLVWPDFGVIVEYDGLQHLNDRRQWERDVVRLEQLARAGWVVIRVTADRLGRPRALVADVEQALRTGGWVGHATYGREWTSAFATARSWSPQAF